MEVDYTLYSLVVCALTLSLSINAICLIKYLGKRFPEFMYKEV